MRNDSKDLRMHREELQDTNRTRAELQINANVAKR